MNELIASLVVLAVLLVLPWDRMFPYTLHVTHDELGGWQFRLERKL